MILTREEPYDIFHIKDAAWQGHITFPIRSEAITVDSFSIYYLAEALDVPPKLCILDIDSQESLELPMQFSPFDGWIEPIKGRPYKVEFEEPNFSFDAIKDPILDFNYYLNSAYRFRNADLLVGIVSFSPDSNEYLYLPEHQEIMNRVGTPQLEWRRNFEGESDGQTGWALTLNGANGSEENPLGFAHESDREGLKQLLEMMKDPERLQMNLALVNPDAAIVLTARKILEDIRIKQPTQSLTALQWQERLHEANLGSLRGVEFHEEYAWDYLGAKYRGSASSIQVDINNNILPVIMRIVVPKACTMLISEHPNLANVSAKEMFEWIENHPQEVSEGQAEWRNRFEKLLAELGYRSIPVPAYSSVDYWITDLTATEFEAIEPGIFEDKVADVAASAFMVNEIYF